MNIVDLYKSWTREQREQALESMPEYRRIELTAALGIASWTQQGLGEKLFEKDVKAKARRMSREESLFVVETLRLGLMNGRNYGSIERCGCYLGTAARRAGMTVEEYCNSRGIKKDMASPAEQWFSGVAIGDTPENSYAAKMGVKWIEEVLAEAK